MTAAPRNLLTGRHDLDAVHRALLPRESFRRYPAASDRTAWESLSAATRAALIAAGECRVGEEWEHLTASLILDYKRKGDRSSYQAPHFRRRTRLQELVLAECAEGRGRFLAAIADNVWLTCEETFWGWPAHLDEQKAGRELPDIAEPIVDLGVGESAALMAWIDHLLGPQLDEVSPLLRARIRHEVDRRMLTPCLERDDFWWMSWDIRQHMINNWNPWCNSNWLACALLLEIDSDRRARAVHKIMRSLDLFINHQPEDGGCDEGPGYWDRAGGSLYDCLELLYHGTGGRISIFAEPLVADMGRFIQRAHVAGDWFMNFADAAAKTRVDGALVQRYGRSINDPKLVDFGRWIAQKQGDRPRPMNRSINRSLAELLDTPAVDGPVPPAPLLRDVWLPQLEVVAARDRAGAADGLFFAAKGGHNAESHNHNDIGSFVVYLDGEPLLIDLGVEAYTAKTFSPQRYEIWTMQSQWHNLPTINGAMEQNGRDFAARGLHYSADDASASFALDIAASYPPAAHIKHWTRTLRLERGLALHLTEDYELSESHEPAILNFVTACEPALGAGELQLRTPAGRTAVLRYSPGAFTATAAPHPVTDAGLQRMWGEQVFRVQLVEHKAVTSAQHAFVLEPRG